MIILNDQLWFPSVAHCSEEGLLAVGGDLSPERLLLAYRSGIFPWFSEGEPILWWSPDPRLVLVPAEFKTSKSMQKKLGNEEFRVTFDQAFSDVIRNCATIERPGQENTWITQNMINSYEKLHEMGHARSVEVWQDEILVGGLYGVDLPEKKVFCGESMFSKVDDASKIALFYWAKYLEEAHYRLIDCQVHTQHLVRLGAREIPRQKFLEYLK